MENKELESFLRDDYDFSQYLKNRNEDKSDLSDIFDTMKSGNTDKISDNKRILKEFLNAPDSDVQEIVKMGQNPDPLMKYISTKILLKCYDNLIHGGMKNQHEIEKKPEQNRTDEESKKLNKMGFKMGLEIAKIMQKSDLKDEFDTMMEIANTCKTANDDTNRSQQIDVGILTKIAKDNKSMLAKILKMAGRFQKTFAHKINTKSDGYDSVIGVEFGNEIESVLPEEIALLHNVKIGSLKRLDFLQGNLMQYKYIGKKPMTGGPIVCCIDESGSMIQGNRIIEAKAYCFGLWQQAKAENRDFTIVRFGESNHVEIHKIENLNDMIKVSEGFFNDNGTDFNSPIRESIDIINKSIKNRGSDIIIVTDGASNLSDYEVNVINEWKNQTQTKIIVIDVTGLSKYYGNINQIASVIVDDYDELIKQS